jgi:threonine dehydrogenase-like Zn-dependent dehydrogenase
MAMVETDRPRVIRQMIHSVRKGGTVSIIGAYGGFSDKIPTGALFNKGLTVKTGQCHVHRYVPELVEHITSGRIDPSFVVTQRMPLSQGAEAYKLFRFGQDESIKIVLDPAA